MQTLIHFREMTKPAMSLLNKRLSIDLIYRTGPHRLYEKVNCVGFIFTEYTAQYAIVTIDINLLSITHIIINFIVFLNLFSALVGSLTIGTTFFLSPIAGILTDKFGIQLTTFLGGAFAFGGMLLASLFSDKVINSSLKIYVHILFFCYLLSIFNLESLIICFVIVVLMIIIAFENHLTRIFIDEFFIYPSETY